jgi:ABC-type multidrug transport system ATPase subunit
MDEPTTGMDPKTRRGVWHMIKNLKQNRSVILTTHAMEEAEILADRIAVIAEGKLQCIGTSLFLKNNFGEGYRLSLVTDPKSIEHARAGIKELIPSARRYSTRVEEAS